jgi:hypothetical protein
MAGDRSTCCLAEVAENGHCSSCGRDLDPVDILPGEVA